MKMSIPYEKEIVFNTKIAEITSISLEYEANVLDEDIEGEFIVSGDYKIHELSVNKEPFKYRIPFSVSLTDDIIRDSIKYDINNFTYEVIDDDTLKVNIEFGVSYEMVKEKEEDSKEELIKDAVTFPNKEEELEKQKREDAASRELNNLLDDIELNNVSNALNTYVTYHIHILNDGEDVNTIINKYKVTKELIDEYNSGLEWVMGEKVIIPDLQDD